MIPNVGNILKNFEQSATLTTTTQTIVNYKPVLTPVDTTIRAVIQPAEYKALTKDEIDSSKSYYQIHTRSAIKINDIIKDYKGTSYKIARVKNYSDYGYIEVIAEEML